MILGIGTDLVDVRRVEKICRRFARRFSERILSCQERHAAPCPTNLLLAKRFAVKEACAKACKTGIGRQLSFQDMSLTHTKQGAPELVVQKNILQAIYPKTCVHTIKVDVSVTDEYPYAQAFVVIWKTL